MCHAAPGHRHQGTLRRAPTSAGAGGRQRRHLSPRYPAGRTAGAVRGPPRPPRRRHPHRVLVEKTEAKRKSDTTDERKANANIDVPSPIVLGRGPIFGATTWQPQTNSKLEFKDSETNTNEVKGAITVTVVEVLANGNLVVAGENQIAINRDTEYIRLSGVVQPARIRADNTVLSTQLANVKFESKNTQSMDVSQLGSMMARFFLTLLPF
ncbi:MAG: flagellar basal body L-ring protein FlgH [Betaproteobacteria bacterium]|nr:flagellar basal body L-ring protein FlgH [Betaproteobacteria bacterium]